MDVFDVDEQGIYRDEHTSGGSSDQGILLDDEGVWREEPDPTGSHYSSRTGRTDSGIVADRSNLKSASGPALNQYLAGHGDSNGYRTHSPLSREHPSNGHRDNSHPDNGARESGSQLDSKSTTSYHISELENSESQQENLSFEHHSYNSAEEHSYPELVDESYLFSDQSRGGYPDRRARSRSGRRSRHGDQYSLDDNIEEEFERDRHSLDRDRHSLDRDQHSLDRYSNDEDYHLDQRSDEFEPRPQSRNRKSHRSDVQHGADQHGERATRSRVSRQRENVFGEDLSPGQDLSHHSSAGRGHGHSRISPEMIANRHPSPSGQRGSKSGSYEKLESNRTNRDAHREANRSHKSSPTENRSQRSSAGEVARLHETAEEIVAATMGEDGRGAESSEGEVSDIGEDFDFQEKHSRRRSADKPRPPIVGDSLFTQDDQSGAGMGGEGRGQAAVIGGGQSLVEFEQLEAAILDDRQAVGGANVMGEADQMDLIGDYLKGLKRREEEEEEAIDAEIAYHSDIQARHVGKGGNSSRGAVSAPTPRDPTRLPVPTPPHGGRGRASPRSPRVYDTDKNGYRHQPDSISMISGSVDEIMLEPEQHEYTEESDREGSPSRLPTVQGFDGESLPFEASFDVEALERDVLSTTQSDDVIVTPHKSRDHHERPRAQTPSRIPVSRSRPVSRSGNPSSRPTSRSASRGPIHDRSLSRGPDSRPESRTGARSQSRGGPDSRPESRTGRNGRPGSLGTNNRPDSRAGNRGKAGAGAVGALSNSRGLPTRSGSRGPGSRSTSRTGPSSRPGSRGGAHNGSPVSDRPASRSPSNQNAAGNRATNQNRKESPDRKQGGVDSKTPRRALPVTPKRRQRSKSPAQVSGKANSQMSQPESELGRAARWLLMDDADVINQNGGGGEVTTASSDDVTGERSDVVPGLEVGSPLGALRALQKRSRDSSPARRHSAHGSDNEGSGPGESLSQESTVSKRELKSRYIEEVSHRRQHEETLDQLQKEYQNLLKKHAEAENVIDDLRLGAKVKIYVEGVHVSSSGTTPGAQQGQVTKFGTHAGLSTPTQLAHQAVVSSLQQSGVRPPSRASHTSSSVIRDNSDQNSQQSQQSQHRHASAGGGDDNGALSHDDLESLQGDGVKLALFVKAKAIEEQTSAFQTLLDEKQLTLEDQKKALDNIKANYEQLAGEYRATKEEHQYRRRQGELSGDPAFDETKEVEGELYRLNMRLDDLEHSVQENLSLQQRTTRRPFSGGSVSAPVKADHSIRTQSTSAEARHGDSERRGKQDGALTREYEELMEKYRRLQTLPQTPARHQQATALLQQLKSLNERSPEPQRQTMPPPEQTAMHQTTPGSALVPALSLPADDTDAAPNSPGYRRYRSKEALDDVMTSERDDVSDAGRRTPGAYRRGRRGAMEGSPGQGEVDHRHPWTQDERSRGRHSPAQRERRQVSPGGRQGSQGGRNESQGGRNESQGGRSESQSGRHYRRGTMDSVSTGPAEPHRGYPSETDSDASSVRGTGRKLPHPAKPGTSSGAGSRRGLPPAPTRAGPNRAAGGTAVGGGRTTEGAARHGTGSGSRAVTSSGVGGSQGDLTSHTSPRDHSPDDSDAASSDGSADSVIYRAAARHGHAAGGRQQNGGFASPESEDSRDLHDLPRSAQPGNRPQHQGHGRSPRTRSRSHSRSRGRMREQEPSAPEYSEEIRPSPRSEALRTLTGEVERLKQQLNPHTHRTDPLLPPGGVTNATHSYTQGAGLNQAVANQIAANGAAPGYAQQQGLVNPQGLQAPQVVPGNAYTATQVAPPGATQILAGQPNNGLAVGVVYGKQLVAGPQYATVPYPNSAYAPGMVEYGPPGYGYAAEGQEEGEVDEYGDYYDDYDSEQDYNGGRRGGSGRRYRANSLERPWRRYESPSSRERYGHGGGRERDGYDRSRSGDDDAYDSAGEPLDDGSYSRRGVRSQPSRRYGGATGGAGSRYSTHSDSRYDRPSRYDDTHSEPYDDRYSRGRDDDPYERRTDPYERRTRRGGSRSASRGRRGSGSGRRSDPRSFDDYYSDSRSPSRSPERRAASDRRKYFVPSRSRGASPVRRGASPMRTGASPIRAAPVQRMGHPVGQAWPQAVYGGAAGVMSAPQPTLAAQTPLYFTQQAGMGPGAVGPAVGGTLPVSAAMTVNGGLPQGSLNTVNGSVPMSFYQQMPVDPSGALYYSMAANTMPMHGLSAQNIPAQTLTGGGQSTMPYSNTNGYTNANGYSVPNGYANSTGYANPNGYTMGSANSVNSLPFTVGQHQQPANSYQSFGASSGNIAQQPVTSLGSGYYPSSSTNMAAAGVTGGVTGQGVPVLVSGYQYQQAGSNCPMCGNVGQHTHSELHNTAGQQNQPAQQQNSSGLVPVQIISGTPGNSKVRYYVREYGGDSAPEAETRVYRKTNKIKTYVLDDGPSEGDEGMNDSLQQVIRTANKLKSMSTRMRESLNDEINRSIKEGSFLFAH